MIPVHYGAKLAEHEDGAHAGGDRDDYVTQVEEPLFFELPQKGHKPEDREAQVVSCV